MSFTSQPARPLAALLAVCLAALCMPLSFTGPAVALPAIAAELPGTPLALAWITNAFMLSFGGCLMAAGALADRYGRKRLFLLGVGVFCAAALALSAAGSLAMLGLMRAVQGLGCALALSSGLAALAQLFDGATRAGAFSLIGTTFGAGLAFGPIAAGVLVNHFGWRSLFVATAATGLAALLLGSRTLRESRDPQAAGLDWPGALSFTGALSLLTYGLLQAPNTGWTGSASLALFGGAALLLALFVAVERRTARPMLDLSLLRVPAFAGVQLLAAAPAFSFVVLLVLLPARLIGVEGYSAQGAGAMLLALSAPMLVLPMAAGVAARRIAPAYLCSAGLLAAAGGLLWLSVCAPGQPATTLFGPLLLIGAGISQPWGLMDGLAVSVAPVERAGMAAGIFNTTRVAGEGLALAIVAALLASFVLTALLALPAIAPQQAALAAPLLAAGDLHGASALLPQLPASQLMQAYGDAMHHLLQVLAAISLLSALLLLVFLRPGVAAGTAALMPDRH
ncbi:MFS transporter [Janthinobacterium aquaticum]|uniref:MFS transporter n=1 Tax=Janthinobacterium sp. FT58W TaxID=2654254 RepID=UPI00126427F1|nr:MFS transporter [Janthinobacterium sp. FT58W]KAB8044290.1 MFS transporter [Janthinobacterium sp. FT58W]